MQLPQYISTEEVQRICREIGIQDWSVISKPEVLSEEAAAILTIVNVQGMDIPLEDFRRGLEVELEHGTCFDDANVTNNHPVLTGMIVLAHLKETMDYYKRIEVAELEGDLLKALISRDMNKFQSKYRELIEARMVLNKAIADQLE